MIILIDAYNLLKTVNERDQMLDQQQWYLKRLEHYAALKKHKIKLIFDGGFWHHAYQEKFNHVTHIFAGKGKSADEVIKDYLNEYSGRDNILLITSDRELANYAQHVNIECLNSYLFNTYVDRALQEQIKPTSDLSIQKIVHTENPELDELMFEGSQQVMMKDEKSEIRLKSGKKLSKKTIKRQRLLNKL